MLLQFVSLCESYPEIEVDISSTIFDTFVNFHNNYPGIIACVVNKKYIGYDIMLDKKFSDYEDFNQNNVKVVCFGICSPNVRNKNIKYPILYHSLNESWPPSVNWDECDPINLGEFLIWNGWGRGSVEVTKEENNHYTHLIILNYNNVKKAVNKFSYIKAVINSHKDPLTNNILTDNTMLRLSELLYLKQAEDNIIPTVDMNFKS